MQITNSRMTEGGLRPGDVVEIRPAREILATLDERGSLEGVPFMPEMLQYIGKQFTIANRVEKICDTVSGAYGSRRMRNTVFLEQLRCDGSAHGGCQAECRLYWKEAWLTKALDSSKGASPDPEEAQALERLVYSSVHRRKAESPHADTFSCQATEALRATAALPPWEPGQYLRELASRNVSLGRFLYVAMRALMRECGRILWRIARRALPQKTIPNPAAGREIAEKLGLQPGEWVEVKGAEEIVRTLDCNHRNKGLVFAADEMLPACGKKYRVRRRINRIIDEASGRLLTIKNDCVALEGFVCTGERSSGRYFCHREVYPYWREAWLRRVEEPEANGSSASASPADQSSTN
jgi:hypothetical protein